mgnify:FL=1|jgi:hypothetical protein
MLTDYSRIFGLISITECRSKAMDGIIQFCLGLNRADLVYHFIVNLLPEDVKV